MARDAHRVRAAQNGVPEAYAEGVTEAEGDSAPKCPTFADLVKAYIDHSVPGANERARANAYAQGFSDAYAHKTR